MPKTQLSIGKLGLTTVASPSFTGSADNWAGAANGVSMVRYSANGAYSISGIAAGSDGDILRFYNLSNYTLSFLHASGSSTSPNQIICPNGVQYDVRKFGGVDLWYDGTGSRWRVLAA
jgi:hypothetical protein